jgi:hypothetical protein
MTVNEAHIEVLKSIRNFEKFVNFEPDELEEFRKIEQAVQNMKKAALAAYYEQKNEIQTLNRVVENVQESEVNIYQQNNQRYNQTSEIFIQNEPNLQIIDLGTHYMNMKDFRGLSLEHQSALFGDRIIGLNRKNFNKLKYILQNYLIKI